MQTRAAETKSRREREQMVNTVDATGRKKQPVCLLRICQRVPNVAFASHIRHVHIF